MAYKVRKESAEFMILKFLDNRMTLSEKDKQHYYSLKKGNEGELIFDSLTEQLKCECLILNDLLLKVNNTMFQIDTLIIGSDRIYFYEVKNYEGDYYFEGERFYKKPRIEYSNPVTQLIRSESLVRQLLQKLNFNFPIEALVVFINPEFTLYQAPLDKPIIFPTQIKSYMKKLDEIPSKLNSKHKNLADKLISLHIEDHFPTQLPPYDYDHLKKGNTCATCSSFSISVRDQKCVCEDCGHEETVEDAVMRHVREYKLLFPNEKITTSRIYEWCSVFDSMKRIRRILVKNFKMVGNRRWVYFE